MSDPWDAQREALGAFIRSQRKLANLSLRQLAEMTSLSNPYLSQIERGLHQPSVRVLPAQPDPPPAGPDTEVVISADERLTPDQRAALIAVYRSMRDGAASGQAPGSQ